MAPPKNALSSAPATLPLTALQSHVAFFDSDGDGIIWPIDTYNGFHAIGFNVILCIISVLIIHSGFSYPTFGTWLPDPYFRLKVDLMHRANHGSDSGSFTQKGEFDAVRFDELFDSYSLPPHISLSFSEGLRMVYGNRNPFDPFGWFAAIFEWGATYLLLWPADGRMTKEDLRGVLDGSLFYKKAEKNNTKKSA